MLFLGIVFLFPETPEITAGDMNYTVVVLGGILGLSLVWYYFPKYGGRHWFTGPVRTIELPSEKSDSTDSLEVEDKNAAKLETVSVS